MVGYIWERLTRRRVRISFQILRNLTHRQVIKAERFPTKTLWWRQVGKDF
jgi:hypothetical protein